MGDDQGNGLADLADAGSGVVVAAVHANAERQRDGWTNNRVLLAVLPPTLALFSVGIGVWDNGNRDRAAADLARREEAAQVAADQSAATRAQRLREAELVLPKYEALLEEVHASLTALQHCRDDLQQWIVNDTGWGSSVGQATAISVDELGVTHTFVPATDAAFVATCSTIVGTLPPVELRLDTALLVSNPQLADAAARLQDDLRTVAATAQHLADAVVDGNIDIDARDHDDKTFADVSEGFPEQLDTAVQRANALITAVRGAVLLDG